VSVSDASGSEAFYGLRRQPCIIHTYNTDWSYQDWLSWPGYKVINKNGRSLKLHSGAGILSIYDEEDLRVRLARTVFTNVSRCSIKESDYEDLRNLETRQDPKLIIEASKEDSSPNQRYCF